MSSVDTLALHRRLTEAGAEPRLAEAITSGIRDAVNGYAASKSDLRELEARIEAKLRDLELRLTIRVGLINAATATLLFLALEYTR